MKRLLGILFATGSLLLAGCATTINSDVTAFHAWPAELQDKSFAFAPEPQQDGDPEYQNYAQLIRFELLRLGFSDASEAKAAALRVSFDYGMQTGTLVVTEPVYDPLLYGPARPWRRAPGPFYNPMWAQPMQQTAYPVFERQLHIAIALSMNGPKLYDVIVHSAGYQGTLPAAMPYMVRSAFAEFPGPSGVLRHITMKIQ